jgi:sulfite reductase (ferredoxin)
MAPRVDTGSEQMAEIRRFAELIERRRRGEIDEEDFRRFRLQHGVYGIRGQTDIQMVRVKIPHGALTAAQLECLGDIAERFAPGIGHITTRQDIQFHWVRLESVPEVLHWLGEVGLTTREACGNVVRNVTACPLAGVCRTEVFDVTLYAAALSRHLLRNPICQALPRKFKIAFSGCATDCAVAGIHDIGAVATVQEENGTVRRGFRLYVGGGLGPVPRAAQLLEPFTPAEELILTATAIVRVFDRLGNRQNRMRARMKFLVEELGIEEFRRLVFEERRALWASWPGGSPSASEVRESALPPATPPPRTIYSAPPGFDLWRRTNVVAQKQAGFYAAYVTVPGGDLTAAQFRALATLLRDFPGLELRTVITQNLVLRWVPEAWLPILYTILAEADLGRPGVHGIGDVVGCPGADTCNLAVTYSHRLALELTRQLAERPDVALADDLKGVTIKISGCPNSCGQHHIATIGLYGAARKVGERQVPFYQLLLGGKVHDGEVIFARPVLRVPARQVPEAIFRLVDAYRSERRDGESFVDWLERKEVGDGDTDETL